MRGAPAHDAGATRSDAKPAHAYFWLGAVGATGVMGVMGRGDEPPEPVVDGGGFTCRVAVPVVAGDEPLFAVFELLFQPAMTRNAISTNTARPAIQPQVPPTLSSRRSTGSLNRGSVNLGSVIIALLWVPDGRVRLLLLKPAGSAGGSEKIWLHLCIAILRELGFLAGTC